MYQNEGGVFLGATLIQKNGSVGGSRAVFVKLQGVKNDLVFPTFGGLLKNPFRGKAKIFAGDLFEYRTNEYGLKPQLFLLKTFKVKSSSAGSASILNVVIEDDGYVHVPFVGDILMKAPETIGGTGNAAAVTSVVKSPGQYTITIADSIGPLSADDILVEAAESGTSKKMLVGMVNSVAPCDYDTFYEPATGDEDFDGARYMLTPALHATAYIKRMSPMPDCVLDLNKSRINGWFEI